MYKLLKTTLFIGIVLICSEQTMTQELTAEEIIDRLRTDLPGRGKRGLSVLGGDPSPPSVNLRVQFAYNKVNLTDETQLTLTALGKALTNEVLDDQKFEIIGHTDASGSADYNQKLSEKRAKEVVSWLIYHYQIVPSRLNWRGEGERKLLDIDAPNSGENRRVEIKTMENE